MSLSKEQTDIIEEFILTGKNSYPAISNRDLANGKQMYLSMKNEVGPIYNIFGSDGYGYVCYGLYKSLSGKMYVTTLHTSFPNDETRHEFSSCIEIQDETWFE